MATWCLPQAISHNPILTTIVAHPLLLNWPGNAGTPAIALRQACCSSAWWGQEFQQRGCHWQPLLHRVQSANTRTKMDWNRMSQQATRGLALSLHTTTRAWCSLARHALRSREKFQQPHLPFEFCKTASLPQLAECGNPSTHPYAHDQSCCLV